MIKVISTGLHTSIQDFGRFGFRDQGIPVSGAMDHQSMEMANHILENDPNAPVLEYVLKGPELFFDQNTYIVLTGAVGECTLDGNKIGPYKRVFVRKNSVLKIGHARKGMYGYIGFRNGIKMKKILNSASHYSPLTPDFALKNGDTFKTGKQDKLPSTFTKIGYAEKEEKKIPAFKGPEFYFLSESSREKILHTEFIVDKSSNRMSLQLNHGESIEGGEIVTSPVRPGTVQVSPSGKIMVLMRDAQTTGGYSRVLKLPDESINKIAQKRPGQKLQFDLLNN
ncbi:MAG: biotin-dependent carboxyltransferase family protein [Brumimicrobium sp.]|nr:biotin-dependent carboxyltransferase family protein [Brumimicrobium sp.]